MAEKSLADEFADFKLEQTTQHNEINGSIKESKEAIEQLTAKVNEMYPAVSEKIKVAEAVKILNTYSQGRARSLIFWLKFAAIVGATLVALSQIKAFLVGLFK